MKFGARLPEHIAGILTKAERIFTISPSTASK